MKIYAIIGLSCLLLGLGVGSQLFPKVKEKTVEVEKIVKDIQTVTKIITRPDGTKEEVTTIVDRSKENKTSTKTIAKTDWHVSVSGAKGLDTQITYTLQVERRILGDIYLGGLVNTDKQLGISIGVEF